MPGSKNKSPIALWLDSILLLDVYKRHPDVEQARRLVMVNTITLLAIIILLIVGTVTYVRGNAMVGALDLSAAGLLLVCILILRRTGRHQIPIYIGMSIMTGLYFFLFVSGGSANTGFLWYYTYPLFTLYIMGQRAGSLFNAILLFPTFTYLLIMWPNDNPQYSQDFTLRFIPSLMCIFIFSYLFEATRQNAHHKLQAKQKELEASIAALRNKEKELQKAHDGLESQVEIRTSELRQSNEDLRHEISERLRAEEQRRELEEQLVRAQKMQAIGTLAGGVAHDLNNILSGITSYPELLLSNLAADSSLRRPLEIVRDSGQKAVTVVQDLLTLSRRSAAVFQVVNLRNVISDYLESPEFKKMISYHQGVVIDTHFNGSHFNISGSMVHLSKTVMNLVTNAVEAMPHGGKVEITLKEALIDENAPGVTGLKPGQYVKLTVSDDGTGMAPEVRERLFEPFFTTKKMGRSGTGLGMAVVWGTLKDHGGHIEVHSTPREGTTFDLYFPAAAMGVQSSKKKLTQIPRGDNQAILVVDDVIEQCQIATDILEQMGYTVHAVSSGEAAVAYLHDEHADLVVLDMTMNPGIDGLETFRRIIAFKPHQRIIIASGYSESEKVQEVLRLGAKSFLKKPYNVASIATMVHKALSDE